MSWHVRWIFQQHLIVTHTVPLYIKFRSVLKSRNMIAGVKRISDFHSASNVLPCKIKSQ